MKIQGGRKKAQKSLLLPPIISRAPIGAMHGHDITWDFALFCGQFPALIQAHSCPFVVTSSSSS